MQAAIVGGAKPSDLPVLLPTKFEMSSIPKDGALGLDVPRALVFRTDEVIE